MTVQTIESENRADRLLQHFDNGDEEMNMALFALIYGPNGYNNRSAAEPHIGKRKEKIYKSCNGRDCVSTHGVAQNKAMSLDFSMARVIGREDMNPKERLKAIMKAKKNYRTKN